MATLTERFLQGEVVDGKFQLRSYLGGSEHSSVFLTQYGDLRPRDAAIKLIPAPHGNAEAQLSLWRLAANLAHPNLMQIWGMGRCDLGRGPMLYVVTELASENLAEIIPQRPLLPEEVREMLGPLLEALAFMHSRGYAHAHIKPSNIMAVGEMLKLSSDAICRLGDNLGNPAHAPTYDAPEISRTGATPAADVWSLGVTLVEILTQEEIAWSGSDRRDPIVPESMPAPYAEFARHCLRRDPKNRWTAADIAAHLPRPTRLLVQTHSVQEQTPAEPAVPEADVPSIEAADEDAPHDAKRSRYMIGAAVLAAVLVAVLIGWKLIAARSGQPASPASSPDTRQQPEATKGAEQATATAPRSPEARPTPPPTPRRTAPATQDPVLAAKAPPPLSASVPSPPPAAPTPAESAPAATSVARNLAQGRVLHQVLPDVPRRASDTIWGTVRVAVRVLVDPAGNVTSARLESAGPSRYFAALSLGAAQKWKFSPPVAGNPATSTWTLHFNYTRSGTTVTPAQAKP